MQSDPRLTLALAALAQPIAEFRSIVEGAIAQGEGFLAAQHATAPERAGRAASSLGSFAARHTAAATSIGRVTTDTRANSAKMPWANPA